MPPDLPADMRPDPRIHASLTNVVRVPDRALTDGELRLVFGGDVDGGLRELVGLRPMLQPTTDAPASVQSGAKSA